MDAWERLDRDWQDAYRAFQEPGLSQTLRGDLLDRMNSIAARQRDIEIELEEAAEFNERRMSCKSR